MSVLDIEKLNEPISKKSLEDDGWVPCRSISDYSLIKAWKKKYITKLPDIGEYNGGWKGWYVFVFKTKHKWQVMVSYLETETPIFVDTMHDLNITIWKIFNDSGHELIG